ncbi:iron chelate uptake ABC transporter family permease subunit [Streptosporangium sp. NBC_01495]|uniref:iron chelate uptake ABC transporter family permease subunit n=1 Tax=Streptosporangium sp. NBC_01495 TaxID=2903899 RepID=UPI002E363797|nr:iron chelate uptake ABC transporter family permease subunit [Streptosporangium sp. NBC_01495]
MSGAGVATTTSETAGKPDGTRPGRAKGPGRRSAAPAAGLLAGVAALVLPAMVSVAVGSRSVPLSTALDALLAPDGPVDHTVIRDLRVPRILIGVGAALGLAGALMQSLTRNPLADPGLLGVNQGAAFGVTVAIGLLGVSDPSLYVWFAFAAAAPQLARRITRSPGVTLLASALTGATLLVGADLAAQRVFAPVQLPVGIMTAAIGGIYLVFLLRRERR